MKHRLTPCQRWEEKLAALHPYDYTPQEHAALEAHLTICNNCANKRSQYDLLTKRIRATVASEHFAEEGIRIPVTQSRSNEIWGKTSEEALHLLPGNIQKAQPLKGSFTSLGISLIILVILMLGSLTFLPHNESIQVGSHSQVGGTSTSGKDPQPLPDTVVRQPTLTVQQIDTILRAYHSPLAGKGQLFYSLGKEYKIDPAFVLAIAMQETTLGTTDHARQTHSLTTIGCYQGTHCVNHYATYYTWDASIKDLYVVFEYYVDTLHKTTIETITEKFSGPLADTPDKKQAYVASIKRMMDQWRSGKIILDK
ncbi:hypothetical protein KDA_45890 [Dictyobacter alpinus]|uniref:Uncharacterized protein n=1 Tax=Dictyobacter alpinus TaxID=2014873 RepID=A0A402BCL8_9CHLR|nr:glucosaminidase domain-containing protein [Dictyobacter alpinus]GCE29105.1 hypothetical protein KDA_45890 [Dictyobacter alpinus]